MSTRKWINAINRKLTPLDRLENNKFTNFTKIKPSYIISTQILSQITFFKNEKKNICTTFFGDVKYIRKWKLL